MTLEQFKAKLRETVERGKARAGDAEFLERLERIEAEIVEDKKHVAERIDRAKSLVKHWSEREPREEG